MKQNINYKTKEKECVNCKKILPFSSFNSLSRVISGLHSRCRECTRKYGREYSRMVYAKDGERIKALSTKWRLENPEKVKAMAKRARLKLRNEVLNAYSSGKPKCACCGEKIWEFLALDHVNNDGYLERNNKYKKGGPTGFYHQLKKLNYPDKYRYQILCHNCNCAKGFYGKCPHIKL